MLAVSVQGRSPVQHEAHDSENLARAIPVQLPQHILASQSARLLQLNLMRDGHVGTYPSSNLVGFFRHFGVCKSIWMRTPSMSSREIFEHSRQFTDTALRNAFRLASTKPLHRWGILRKDLGTCSTCLETPMPFLFASDL